VRLACDDRFDGLHRRYFLRQWLLRAPFIGNTSQSVRRTVVGLDP
jgi:hypothetical protein